jgi:DNA polymerase-3 subunit alpha
MAFAGHFHVHDEFSPLDGTGSRNQLTKEAVKHGHTHLGCTNHGRLGSALDHVHACRHPEELDDPDDPGQKRSADERLIPILGIEAFWRPNRFMDLSDQDQYGKNGHNWAQHLCVHAANLEGWHTLMRLSSKSWVRREEGGGFYGKPCFDWDMLENDHAGIVISTACLASPLSQLILKGDDDGAKEFLERMCQIVGPDNVWLEIMPHDLDQQRIVNIEKVNLANELGLGYMVTGDVHMPYKDWMDTQSVVRMAAYGTTITKQEKKKEAGEEIYTTELESIYLSSEQDLFDMFEGYHPDLPEEVVQEGLDNTAEFTKRFHYYIIGKTVKLPKASTKGGAEKVLYRWAEEGLQRHGKFNAKYRERLDYEFDVIKGKGTLDYFYIVADMLRWANSDKPLPATKSDLNPPKKRAINTDVRGSAAGCLFSWAIGITTMDPIAWGLKFERFLNPDRVGLPDIDIDIESEFYSFEIDGKQADGREMCIEYLRRTYGHDHVAAIISYQTFAPRRVINDVSRVLELPYKEVEAVTESIGEKERGIDKIADDNPVVSKFREKYPDAWKHMTRLEDQVLRDTRHAAGIVVTPRPVSDYMPTQIGSDEQSVVTAWADRAAFPIISDYGFVKLDVLGVGGLAKQELARQFIRDYYGEDFDVRNQPEMYDPWYPDNKDVLALFSKGITLGLFQFAGRGITQLLRHIKPDNAMDISVANALYRPGPMSMAFEYGDRKNGKTPITYWHESLEPILGETLGLMCFQEQAMDVVQQLAGFSAADADNFRKIMSKLYRLPGDAAQRVMQKDHDRFIEGCMTISGMREATAEDLWSTKMLPLGNYLFNKSHSSDYGLRAIIDARIKLNYPLAFYASLLTLEKKSKKADQIDFVKSVMREAAIFDVEVAPPDVNTSELGWGIDGDSRIRYGLVSISGLGGASAREIIDNRPFSDFKHFIRTMPSGFGANSIVALAKAGAFDDMERRKYLLSLARKWGSGIRKVTIDMSCGCKKSRTIKLTDQMLELIEIEFEDVRPSTSEDDLLDMATELVCDEIECDKHADGEVAKVTEVVPHYFVAAWYKEHADNLGGSHPVIDSEPSPEQLIEYEIEALNVPLSMRKELDRYTPFIAERIYTQEEVDALPPKPQKKGKKHGGTCACADCEAAHCVVGGEITNVKRIQTRSGEWMAFAEVAFEAYSYSLTIFPWAYRKFGKLLDKPSAFLFAGHKQERNGQSNILVYDIKDIRDIAEAEGWHPVPNLGEIAQRAVKRMKIKRKVAA